MCTQGGVCSRGAYVYDSLVVFDIAEHLESAKLPFSALGCVDRGHLEVAVYGRSLVVDEFDRPLLRPIYQHQSVRDAQPIQSSG